MARSIFDQLKSESAKLEAVKEQVLMRFIGLGWVDAHHPWSAKGEVFNAIHLFHHFIEKVLPLANKLEVPSEPPANFPSPPEMVSLGTMSELSCMFVGNGDTLENLKKSAIGKRKSQKQKEKWTGGQPFNVTSYQSWMKVSLASILKCFFNMTMMMGPCI